MSEQPIESGALPNDLVLLDESNRPYLRGFSRQLPLPRVEFAIAGICAAVFLIGLVFFSPVIRLPTGSARQYSPLVPLAAGFGIVFGIGEFIGTRRVQRLSRDGRLLTGTIRSVARERAGWQLHRSGSSSIKFVLEFKLPVVTSYGFDILDCRQELSLTTYNGLQRIPNVVGRPVAVLYVHPKLYRAL